MLVRAIEPAFEIEWMRANRSVAKDLNLTNGPAKFCAALTIDRTFDGVDLCDASSPLFIATNPERDQLVAALGSTITTKRVGITQAADLPLRFYLNGSRYVSRRERLR